MVAFGDGFVVPVNGCVELAEGIIVLVLEGGKLLLDGFVSEENTGDAGAKGVGARGFIGTYGSLCERLSVPCMLLRWGSYTHHHDSSSVSWMGARCWCERCTGRRHRVSLGSRLG